MARIVSRVQFWFPRRMRESDVGVMPQEIANSSAVIPALSRYSSMVMEFIMGTTYAGRNFPVKPKLHVMALHAAQQTRIMAIMSQKSAGFSRFAHRYFFKEWRKHRNLTQS